MPPQGRTVVPLPLQLVAGYPVPPTALASIHEDAPVARLTRSNGPATSASVHRDEQAAAEHAFCEGHVATEECRMGQYADLMRKFPGLTLGAALQFAQTDFQEDFLELWGLDESAPPPHLDRDDWLAARQVHGRAQQIGAIAMLLLKRKGVGPQGLALGSQLSQEASAYARRIEETLALVADSIPAEDFAQLEGRLKSGDTVDPLTRRMIFENTMQIEATKLLPRTLDAVAARLEALVGYVVLARGARTNRYLARVASCYCLDLRAELAVMARAVLDAALQEFLHDDAIRKDRRVGPHSRVGLGDRLGYIKSLDLAKPAELDAMHAIKKGGDVAVHDEPGKEPQPDATMANLVASLNAIERFPEPTHDNRA